MWEAPVAYCRYFIYPRSIIFCMAVCLSQKFQVIFSFLAVPLIPFLRLFWRTTNQNKHSVMIWACSCSCLFIVIYCFSYHNPLSCTLVILFHVFHIPVILPCTHVFSTVTSMSSYPAPCLFCIVYVMVRFGD